jgi:hypothetical protein
VNSSSRGEQRRRWWLCVVNLGNTGLFFFILGFYKGPEPHLARSSSGTRA